MVMVGERGMIAQKAIDEMSKGVDVAWVTALRISAIRTLVAQGAVHMANPPRARKGSVDRGLR